MIEITLDGKSEAIKIPQSEHPIVQINNAIIVFSLNEEIADNIIETYIKPSAVEQIFIYNYDEFQDIESYKKGLEKLFYNCIFINNKFVNNVYVFNVKEDFHNATNEQILASQKKITKNNGEKWPIVDKTAVKLLSFITTTGFDGPDNSISYFCELTQEYKITTVETPLDYVPDGYPDTDEEGLPISYKQIDYYENYFYGWPVVKNIANFYGGFIFTSSANDVTMTVRAYRFLRTEYVQIGGESESE